MEQGEPGSRRKALRWALQRSFRQLACRCRSEVPEGSLQGCSFVAVLLHRGGENVSPPHLPQTPSGESDFHHVEPVDSRSRAFTLQAVVVPTSTSLLEGNSRIPFAGNSRPAAPADRLPPKRTRARHSPPSPRTRGTLPSAPPRLRGLAGAELPFWPPRVLQQLHV